MAGAEPLPSGGRRFVLQRALGKSACGDVYLAKMESTGGFRRRVTSEGRRAVARVGAPRAVACTLDGEVLTCR